MYDIPVLEACIKQKGKQVLFGTEAPGSGGAVRPETGKPSDDLVPIIGGFDWLPEEEKLEIFNGRPAYFCEALKAAGAVPA